MHTNISNSTSLEKALESVLTKLVKKYCFISQIIVFPLYNCDFSPWRSYSAHQQYFRSYRYLLIALLCIYHCGHWMLLALQLSGISMTCKILLWLGPCVCHCVCVCVCAVWPQSVFFFTHTMQTNAQQETHTHC